MRRHDRRVAYNQIIYREEVLTVMALLGDIRAELIQIREELEDDGEEEAEEDS
jgi:hypothetical protein